MPGISEDPQPHFLRRGPGSGQKVEFVQHKDLRSSLGANLTNHIHHVPHVFGRLLGRRIHYVQQERRFSYFLECGSEGTDEGGRQVANETDGVAH